MAKKNKTIIKISPPPASEQTLKFSFEYYDHESDEYCLSCWNKDQIRATLLRLQGICKLNYNDLVKGRKVYHFGEVRWQDTCKKNGFPNQNLKDLPAFHFSLLGVNNQKARVFGAYSSGVFYIVWFDLEHTIWPSPKKHT